MGKPPLPPPSSTNKRRKNNNNYHPHELDAQTTVLGIVSQSPLGPRWSEEECVAFFNGLKEERDGFENKYSEHIPNFDSIAAEDGEVGEGVREYVR